MPQTPSAKKALRVSLRRRASNDRWRARFRTTERKLRRALALKQTPEAAKLFVSLQSLLARMARRHIVHRNTASRRTARFATALRANARDQVASPRRRP